MLRVAIDELSEAETIIKIIVSTQIDSNNILFGKLQENHKQYFIFFQNTLLRMMAAESYEVLMLLEDSFMEGYKQLIKNYAENNDINKLLDNLFIVADCIICSRYLEIKTESGLDNEVYKELAKGCVSATLTMLSAGTIPALTASIPKNADDIPMIAFTAFRRILSLHDTKETIHKHAASRGATLLGFIKLNKLKILGVTLAAIAVAAVSILIPPVGIAVMVTLLVYSGYKMIKKISDRIKINHDAKIILNQQIEDFKIIDNTEKSFQESHVKINQKLPEVPAVTSSLHLASAKTSPKKTTFKLSSMPPISIGQPLKATESPKPLASPSKHSHK